MNLQTCPVSSKGVRTYRFRGRDLVEVCVSGVAVWQGAAARNPVARKSYLSYIALPSDGDVECTSRSEKLRSCYVRRATLG